MTSTTLVRNGNGTTLLKGASELLNREGVESARIRVSPPPGKVEPNGEVPEQQVPAEAGPRDEKPALAVFCYAEPDGLIGQTVRKTVAALARRETPVHLFTRHDFGPALPGVSPYVVGEGPEGDLVDAVQEFGRRACNAFLQRFPYGCENVTLMGYEWSSFPAVSILRGLKNLGAVLSVHSLERQRSDLASELSQRIQEIELTGLREARSILVQEPATAEVAKYWLPECAGKIAVMRQPFPVHEFSRQLDPGAIKARYQVGPVDPTVVYVGDMSERYGPDVVLKAMPAALKNNPQVRLILVGDGQMYWPLRVYSRYLLLEHAVRLPGSVGGTALHELIQAADLVIVPSREATPWWPILAAWAARRPVAATHTAAPGLVEHGKDGILFYPSENSCVWGIEHILFNPEVARTLAENGYQKLEDRFGWGIVAGQVEELMGLPARP